MWGLVIVIVLCVIAFVAYKRYQKRWIVTTGKTYGVPGVLKTLDDGSLVFLSTKDTLAECQDAASKGEYTSYQYYGADAPAVIRNGCFGGKHTTAATTASALNVATGYKQAPKTEAFDTKLMMRAGMENAGARKPALPRTSVGSHFSASSTMGSFDETFKTDPTIGTEWAGRQ